MHLIPHVRTWGKRLIAGALGLAALYLLAANLFLLPGVGPGLISRRPERFRIGWRSAWSVWPGEVRFTGLELRGHQPRVRWWITAEEGTARIDLPALLRREVRVEHLRAWGVRSQTDRLPRPETTEPVPPPRRGPWTVRLEQVELSGVRTLGYGPLQLEGDGRIAGSLRIVMRREVELGATVLTMPHGRLRLDGAHGADIARETNVRAELRLGPYSPRQHRGIARFDFLTGRLTADGKVLTTVETPRGASPSEVPAVLQRFLGMKGAAAGDAPRGVSTVGDVGLGALAVDLRLEQGRLVRGSRLRFAAPGGSRLAVSAEVTDRLALAAEGWNLTLQWRDGSPFLAVDAARLTADSSELRLSRLIAETRSGRVRDPLRGNVEATGLRLWAVGRTAAAEITAEQGSGQLGLAALLGRRVVLDHLRASGVAVRVERGRRSSTVPSGGQSPWQLEMTNARIERLREVAIDALRIEGAGEVAGSLAWDGSALVIRDGALEVRGGRVWRGSEELARGVDARLTGGVDPCALRQHPGLAALDCATLGLRATAEVPRLQAMAAMVGSGPLRTDLRIERGIVRPGSFLEMGSGRSGASVIATVEEGGEPRLAAEVRDLALGGGPDRPPVLRAAAARASVPAGDLQLGRLLAALDQGRESLPAVVDLEVSGLRMGAPGERIAWSLALDRANGRIDLGALARREVVLSGVRAAGGRLEVRKSAPGEMRPPAPGTPSWKVRIPNVRITGVREASFGPNRLLGNGQIEGSLEAAFGGGARTCRLDRLALTFGSAWIESGGKTVARGVSLLSDLRIAPFTPGELRGARLFRLISGSLAVDGDVSSLGFLRPYFRQALGLDGRGHLSADVRLGDGFLLPGSRITVDPAEVTAEYLLSRATGSAKVEGLVVPGPEPHLVLGIDFSRFQLAARDRREALPHVVGEGMQLSLTSADLDLATRGKRALVRIVLPEADVRDLAFYNGYLPPGTGVSILEGAGRLGFDLRLQTEGQTAQGEVTLRSDAMKVRVEDLELAGALDLRARLSSPDLRTRRFTLDGTSLFLDRVEIRHVGPDAGPARGKKRETAWWARVSLERGAMEWTRPLTLTSSVRLEVKEAGFLFNFLSRRRPYLAWFGNRLRRTPLVAHGELRLAQGAIEVEPLEVLGGHFDIRSRLRLSRESRHGHLFVRWRQLALGVDLEGRERRYRLVRPLEWFLGERLTSPPDTPAATVPPPAPPDPPAGSPAPAGARSTARGRPGRSGGGAPPGRPRGRSRRWP
jgi:hypothetical protein